MRLPVNTVIHTTLVGLEPTIFRSLVRRATSSATEPAVKCRSRSSPMMLVEMSGATSYSNFISNLSGFLDTDILDKLYSTKLSDGFWMNLAILTVMMALNDLKTIRYRFSRY